MRKPYFLLKVLLIVLIFNMKIFWTHKFLITGVARCKYYSAIYSVGHFIVCNRILINNIYMSYILMQVSIMCVGFLWLLDGPGCRQPFL